MITRFVMLRCHSCPSQAASHFCQVASQRKDSLCFILLGRPCDSSLSHSVDRLVIPGMGTEELVCLLTEIMDIFPAVLLGGEGRERK